jgi:ATP-dependent exoDNAse (exonuclease V) beta subunit
MPEAPSPLTIVPSGAGSGKTYFLQQELTARIKAGLAPDKIVAVTFTEAATRDGLPV